MPGSTWMPEVTFFMIVTPRDAVVAESAIRSYQKLRGLDFELVVYSNYLLPEQKAYYFPRWERFPFVRIKRNDQHDADLAAARARFDDNDVSATFEFCDPIWDRELHTFQSPFVATVDPDFEILNQRFVHYMLARLRASDKLIGFSTEYSPTAETFEPYSGERIILSERNLTCFCMYKREAFEKSQVSHAYRHEINEGAAIRRVAWDSCGYFQKSLRDQGYEFGHLGPEFRHDCIHYGAFVNNTSITRRNVNLYRASARLEHFLPPRWGGALRRVRRQVLPRLENNRFQYSREAPVNW